jgi:hypothetical protein
MVLLLVSILKGNKSSQINKYAWISVLCVKAVMESSVINLVVKVFLLEGNLGKIGSN